MIGVFLPFMHDPSSGTVSFWSRGGGGVAIPVYVNKSITLWYTGLAAAALLTYRYMEYQFALETSLNEAKANAFGVSLSEREPAA
jgi:hypothetical protein